MRFRGINHVDIAVIDYDVSIKYYDVIFGWLGYSSFRADAGGFEAIYYFAFPHSAVGVHRASPDATPVSEGNAGIHHLALWAKSRDEVDRFYQFLCRQGVEVIDVPAQYPQYSPGYYAVFFKDPSGIRWELVHAPLIPGLKDLAKYRAHMQQWAKAHPGFRFWRKLPDSSLS